MTLQRGQAQLKIRVLEQYRTFRSSVDFRRTVESLLRSIPPKYLAGLDRIVLRDSGGLSRHERKMRELRPGKVLLGAYHPTRKAAPHIDLFIDVLATRWPSVLVRIPPLREILVAEVLFHEVGHHIHARIAPEHKDSEAAAEAWRRRLSREHFRRRYWYLRPLAPFLRLLGKALRRLRKKQRRQPSA